MAHIHFQNSRHNRCALSSRGVRYWQYVPPFFLTGPPTKTTRPARSTLPISWLGTCWPLASAMMEPWTPRMGTRS
jgi:hypothetical protein